MTPQNDRRRRIISDNTPPYIVLFPAWFDEQFGEDKSKGYLSDVEIRFNDGASYRLYFADPIRLQQDAETEFSDGTGRLPGTRFGRHPRGHAASALAAVEELFAGGFFESLRAVTGQKNIVPSSHP